MPRFVNVDRATALLLPADLREWVFTVAVERFEGSFSAEHAIGRKNQAFYDRYTPDEIRRLAAGLKTITSPGPLGTITF